MKKIIATILVASTALSAAPAFASSVYTGGSSGAGTAYTTNQAGNVRDALTTVYNNFSGWTQNDGTTYTGGTFGASNAGAEYAKLLYMIDNVGTITPITLSFDAVTGALVKSGGDSTGDFSLNEILDQVDVFVEDLNNDLFGSNAGSLPTDLATPAASVTGHASAWLNDMIDRVNDANTILADNTKTHAEKIAARDAFNTHFDGQVHRFNNSITTLKNVGATFSNLEAVTNNAGLAGWELSGSSVTDEATDGANIVIDATSYYDSYTDYVAGIISYHHLVAVNNYLTINVSGTNTNFNLPGGVIPGNWSVSGQGTAELTITTAGGNTFVVKKKHVSGGNVASWSVREGSSSGTQIHQQNTIGQSGLQAAIQWVVDNRT